MDSSNLLAVLVLAVLAFAGTGLLWYFFVPRNRVDLSALRGKPLEEVNSTGATGGGRGAPNEAQLKNLKREAAKKVKSKNIVTLDEKFFQAGLFTKEDQREFFLMRTFLPLVLAPALGIAAASSMGLPIGLACAALGGAFGYRWPYMRLDKKLKLHAEDILFYLPLVIEQIVIGVSSSLDIGPCIQRVVTMADERDTHNCCTELLRVVQHYMRSGVSMEDALVEVGRRAGHTELKHTFMSLAQVARHGGEVSKQLQELADAVSNQREARIETKIKKLELEATVPVAVVFCGFLLIILSGFGVQIKDAFK